MDHFVTRTPTWKTLELSSFSRSFANISLTGKKSTPKTTKSRPSVSRKLSISEVELKRIFTRQSDEPLVVPSGQQASSNSPLPMAVAFANSVDRTAENSQHTIRLTPYDENSPPPNDENYVNRYGALAQSMCQNAEGPLTPKNMIQSNLDLDRIKENPFLARIQKDLNSPSAMTRIRAIRALRSPTNCAYTNFDIPHEEQDIITEEERKSPVRVWSIEELMKDVIVYVEVRAGEDNRSSGVKKVIAALGAKVNDKLLRDTTHVVFKDGLLSTYNKAKKWNIPIVSILWIEACKKQMKLMPPKDFPISNVDRYENPELYDKIKRYKSMQPESEQNRHHKSKSTPKENVMKSKRLCYTPTNGNRKTDLTNFFKPLEPTSENSKSSSKDPQFTPSLKTQETDPLSATPSCSKINGLAAKIDTIDEVITNKLPSVPQTPKSTRRRSLLPKTHSSNLITRLSVQTRRRTCLFPNSIPGKEETANNYDAPSGNDANLEAMSFKESRNMNATENPVDIVPDTPSKNLRRNPRRITHYATTYMEESNLKSIQEKPTNSKIKRLTTWNTNPMDLSPNPSNSTSSGSHLTPINGLIPSSTLIEEDSAKTPMQFSSLLNEHAAASVFSSAKAPVSHKRRTLYDVSLDIISQRLQNINQSANRPDKTHTKPQDAEIVALLNQPETTNKTIRKQLFAEGDKLTTEQTPTDTKRKRKLFAPNEVIQTPPEIAEPMGSINKDISRTPAISSTKRTKKPTPLHKQVDSVERRRSTRRSMLDFESIKKTKPASKRSTCSSARRTDHTSEPKKYPFLVYTNMHKEQIEFIKEAISKLQGFQLESNVTDKTTHVISLESRRTINLLRGLVRGLWILNYNWVVDSVNAGRWLDEETYELREFSPAIEICRSERQAFGSTYKMDLFRGHGPIFISSKSKVPKESLSELITLCAGRVVDQRKRAKYILGDVNPIALPGKIYLDPQWILDSISNKQIQKHTKYLANSLTVTKKT